MNIRTVAQRSKHHPLKIASVYIGPPPRRPVDAVPVLIANEMPNGDTILGYPPKARPILSDVEWVDLSGLSGLTDQEDRDALDFLMQQYRGMRTVELATPSPGKIRSDLAKLRSQVLKIAAQLPEEHRHSDALQGIARELDRIADRQPRAKPGPKSLVLRQVLLALNSYLLDKTGKQITGSKKHQGKAKPLKFAIRFFEIADPSLSNRNRTITEAIKNHLRDWRSSHRYFLTFDHSERSHFPVGAHDDK